MALRLLRCVISRYGSRVSILLLPGKQNLFHFLSGRVIVDVALAFVLLL